MIEHLWRILGHGLDRVVNMYSRSKQRIAKKFNYAAA